MSPPGSFIGSGESDQGRLSAAEVMACSTASLAASSDAASWICTEPDKVSWAGARTQAHPLLHRWTV